VLRTAVLQREAEFRFLSGRRAIFDTNGAQVAAERNLVSAPQPSELEDCNVENKRLLVVDDQISLTKIVGSIATEAGLEVRIVNDPTQALDAYLDYRPDIMILDMVMPEKDGVDVLNEIMLTGVDSKIILTSGFTDTYVQLAAGVVEFHNKGPVRQLKKPFRRDQLLTMLREILGELPPASA